MNNLSEQSLLNENPDASKNTAPPRIREGIATLRSLMTQPWDPAWGPEPGEHTDTEAP